MPEQTGYDAHRYARLAAMAADRSATIAATHSHSAGEILREIRELAIHMGVARQPTGPAPAEPAVTEPASRNESRSSAENDLPPRQPHEVPNRLWLDTYLPQIYREQPIRREDDRQIFICGPIGSEGGYLGAAFYQDCVIVRRGCFTGTLDEFRAAVERKHGAVGNRTQHGDAYARAINLIDQLWSQRRAQLPRPPFFPTGLVYPELGQYGERGG